MKIVTKQLWLIDMSKRRRAGIDYLRKYKSGNSKIEANWTKNTEITAQMLAN